MYISTRQKKRFTVFAVLLLIFLFIFLFVLLGYREGLQPKSVVLSNVRENGVVVTWVTYTKSNGSLILYEDGERIGEFKDARSIGKRYTNYVEITNLKPSTLYEFEITPYGNDIFEFSTSDVYSEIFSPNILKGRVDAEDAIAFLLVDDLSLTYPLSTYVTAGGEWFFDLSKLITISGDFTFRNDTPLKLLFYSDDGVKVIQGNRNLLFNKDGEFQSAVELDGVENIFSYVPGFAKFEDGALETVNIVADVDRVEPFEEIMGVETEEEKSDEENMEEEEVESENDEVEGWGRLNEFERLTDYGLR